MKQIFIMLAMCFLILLTGCSNKEFDNAVNEGNIALANKEYVKAESNFRLALSKKNDPEIFKLNDQTSKIVLIKQYQKDKNYDKALDLCTELEKEEFINDLVKNDVIKLKKDIEKDKTVLDSQKKEQDKQVSKNKENPPSSKNNNDDLIKKAKNAIYKATGTSSSSVKLNYNKPSNLGTIFTDDMKNKYYIFSGVNISDEMPWDTYTLVDKNTFEVFEMAPNGEIFKPFNNTSAKDTQSKNTPETYKCLVYTDCTIDFVHGHDDEGNWTPEDENGERGYGVCIDCGECVVGNDPHACFE